MSALRVTPFASSWRAYHESGWTGVLPLPPGAKTPPPDGTTGTRGRDPSVETLETWERTRGDGNVALRMPPGVVGIDVDAYGSKVGGETLAALEAAYGALPPTWRSSARPGTVSGIRFYRVPPGTRFSGGLGRHIDVIQHHHRYAVVWPSTNPAADGAPYRWHGPDGEPADRVPRVDELAELPPTWLNLQGELESLPSGNTQPVVEVKEGGILVLDLTQMWAPFELPAVITAGDRNETLFRYACSLVGRGVRDVEAVILLEDAYARCQPPWRDEEPADMWDRAKSAYGRTGSDSGDAVVGGTLEELLASDQLAVDVDRAAYRLIVRERAEQRIAELDQNVDAWSGADWGEDDDAAGVMPLPRELTFAPGRALMAPGVNCLFGAPATGKSWLAYEAVVQAVQRGPDERALIIDYEMSQGEAAFRLRLLGLSMRQIREQVVYLKPPGPFSDVARDRLAARFGGGAAPSVVVLDSVNESLGKHNAKSDYTSSSDVARWGQEFVRELQRLWPAAVLILIDHVKKNGGGGPQHGSPGSVSPIGSQAKEALLDAMFSVELVAGAISQTQEGVGKVTCRKDRRGWFTKGTDVIEYTFGGGAPLTLREWTDGAVIFDVPDYVDLELRLARYVGINEGQSVETVRRAVQGAGGNTWTDVKDDLVARGVLTQQPRKGLRKGPEWEAFMSAAEGSPAAP